MKKYILKIIGVFILIFILRDVDIRSVALNIKNSNPLLLVLTVFLEMTCIIPKVIKWQVILRALGIKSKFIDSLRAYWSGLFFGAITPGKIGDMSRIYFLNKGNYSVGRSIFSVILDRLSDVMGLLLIGLVVSFFYLEEIKFLNIVIFLALAGICLFVALIFYKRDLFYGIFIKLLLKFIPKDKLPLGKSPNLGILREIRAKDCILVSMYLLLSWAIYFLAYWVLSRALFMDMHFLYLVGTITVATIISLIPISIGGLGTRDAAIIFMLSRIGIPKSSAFSLSLMIFAIGMFIVSLGFPFSFRAPDRITNG